MSGNFSVTKRQTRQRSPAGGDGRARARHHPDSRVAPLGWAVLPVEAVEPAWWTGRRGAPPPAPALRSVRRPRRPEPAASEADGLFAAPQPVVAAMSLGQQVVASEVYKAQQAFVRRAPDKATVAAVVDALAVEGRLSAVATAAQAGRAGRDPDGVAATLQRLLNVEGYPVLTVAGGTVELNVDLLKLQFQVADDRTGQRGPSARR